MAAATPAAADINRASLALDAHEITQSHVELGWFSGTVLVAHAGKPIYQQSFGIADHVTGQRNTNDTRYNLGSIAKHYTAALVLKQVAAGQISLKDKLQAFGLGFPDQVENRITIRHLLEHRSGFPGRYPPAYAANPLNFASIDERLALHKHTPLMFEPGTDQRYSNYGYVVLGAVLEQVTGRSFASLLRTQIFEPLKLRASVYPYEEDGPNQSQRYTFTYAGEQDYVGVTEHHGPDGGIEATAEDVLKFYRTLFYTDELLPRNHDAVREFFAINGKYWSAFGGGVGVSAAVELDLTRDVQIIVLANSDQLVAEEISGRILQSARGEAYPPARLPPQAFAWASYQNLGPERFKAQFAEHYAASGYSQFIGRTLNELAMSLLKTRNARAAFDMLDTLARRFPNAPEVFDSLAYAHWYTGDKVLAEQTFRKALELRPEFNSAYSTDNYGVASTGTKIRK